MTAQASEITAANGKVLRYNFPRIKPYRFVTDSMVAAKGQRNGKKVEIWDYRNDNLYFLEQATL